MGDFDIVLSGEEAK